MRDVDGTSSPLAFFGAELRRTRMEAGLSQEQLGQRIGYSGTLIGKVEIGERAPSEDLAGRCDEALGTKGLLARIYDLARRWDGGYPSWFAGWMERERTATSVCWWEPLLIPDEGRTTEAPSAVAKLTQTFNVLRGEALSQAASRELIIKVAEESWT
jgi:transcriptional regulator with XRE-family HTH domain